MRKKKKPNQRRGPLHQRRGRTKRKNQRKGRTRRKKTNKQTNKPDQRRGPLNQRRGRTQGKKKKNQKQKEREDQDRSGWLWSVSVGHGWVGWLQIRVKKTQATRDLGRVRLGWKNPRQHAAQVSVRPGSRMTWAAHTWVKKTQAARRMFWVLLVFFFFFSGFSLICSGLFSIFIGVGNRVLETWFPCGRHVEKYATLDHIRPWKSSQRLDL